MPVSHSHQFLWVSRSPSMRASSAGFAGSVTSQISCACAAEHAQQVEFVGIALGQGLAVAHAHHLGAALLVCAFEAGEVLEIFRMGRIGHVEDRGAVELGLRRSACSPASARPACRRGGRYRRCSDRPACGSSADRRCAPAGRCSRPGACSSPPAARRSSAAARAPARPRSISTKRNTVYAIIQNPPRASGHCQPAVSGRQSTTRNGDRNTGFRALAPARPSD